MKNKYITVMFPYPSGSGLHIGHWYNYAIVDSYCRLQKYLGNGVFQPFGFDSHGLPTENYAKKVGRDVEEVSQENIENFIKEMQRMDTSFEYILSTHTEDYVAKTQEIFNILLKRGLAYKAVRLQNYCGSCETVLANEQVVSNKCERCNTEIEQKELEQWFFKITNYKDRLIKDLSKVDYPEKTKKQQLHWLENIHDWCVSRQRKWGCPIPIEAETDTLDTFVDSSFYTVIYDNSRPVDIYVGGNEHACGHLIYARFITKVLFDEGLIDFDEPFLKIVHQGMILGSDGDKMSKSKGNTINPYNYEPQALRMYLMFINHYFEGGKWQDDGYKGCVKFINRFNNWITSDYGDFNSSFDGKFEQLKSKTKDLFELWKTNRIVSEWMIFYNENKKEIISAKQKEKVFEYFKVFF